MRAVLEHIEPDAGSSFKVRRYYVSGANCPGYWHYHPDYELVWVSTGSATLHVGTHQSRYENGLLVLVGPNLPHRGMTEDMLTPREEIVIQFDRAAFGGGFFDLPDLEPVHDLLARSSAGLQFSQSLHAQVGPALCQLPEQSATTRLGTLLLILAQLANDKQVRPLDGAGTAWLRNPYDNGRAAQLLAHVRATYQEPTDVARAADKIGLSSSAFRRYVRLLTSETYTDFVNQYRITQARRLLLIERELPVADIASQCGYTTLAHFNAQFRRWAGMTPSAFRRI